MDRSVNKGELKTRGYLFIVGTALGAVVGFAAGLIVAWRIWLKALRWLWARAQRVAGRAPAPGDEFDFQMLIQ